MPNGTPLCAWGRWAGGRRKFPGSNSGPLASFDVVQDLDDATSFDPHAPSGRVAAEVVEHRKKMDAFMFKEEDANPISVFVFV